MDRAALDVAAELGLARGGWCPLHRKAEDGAIPARYPLTPTPSPAYAQRTRWNVRDADATLVISPLPPAGGTGLTVRAAKVARKPLWLADPEQAPDVAGFRAWLAANGVTILNVAGPRESEQPGIHGAAVKLLRALLEGWGET